MFERDSQDLLLKYRGWWAASAAALQYHPSTEVHQQLIYWNTTTEHVTRLCRWARTQTNAGRCHLPLTTTLTGHATIDMQRLFLSSCGASCRRLRIRRPRKVIRGLQAAEIWLKMPLWR